MTSEPEEKRVSRPIPALALSRFDDRLSLCAQPPEEPPLLSGRSSKLEKPFLRLTGAPNPAHIRPLKVLRLALEHVKSRYLSGEGLYEWACEQLKSIRQDLTVQGIQNRFAAHVSVCRCFYYLFHIALIGI